MKAIIRIKGLVDIPKRTKETMERLRLRRKYSCVLLKNSKETDSIIMKARNLVAYGDPSNEMLIKLIEKRALLIDKKKKIDPKKVLADIEKNGLHNNKEIKPFFRLHPPRKGIKSKLHYPKGALGNHGKEIDKLIERML